MSSVWRQMWLGATQETSSEEQSPGGHPVPRLEGHGNVREVAVLHVPKPKIQVTFYQTASRTTLQPGIFSIFRIMGKLRRNQKDYRKVPFGSQKCHKCACCPVVELILYTSHYFCYTRNMTKWGSHYIQTSPRVLVNAAPLRKSCSFIS